LPHAKSVIATPSLFLFRKLLARIPGAEPFVDDSANVASRRYAFERMLVENHGKAGSSGIGNASLNP